MITKEQLMNVFSYWEVILGCHKGFLTSIEQRVTSGDSIGEVFLEKVRKNLSRYHAFQGSRTSKKNRYKILFKMISVLFLRKFRENSKKTTNF